MLIILEGCDGSGKTTLAKQLATLLDAEIIHCSTTTPNDYYFFMNIIQASKKKNIIADRFCYGQFVYQSESDRPLANSHPYDALKNLGYIETELLRVGAKVVYVTAPEQIIMERLYLRGEKLLNGLNISEIQNRYKAIRKMSCLTWLDYNTGGEE